MANEITYLKGWENAKMSYYNSTTKQYIAIACVVGVDGSNESVYEENVSVCTGGKVVKDVIDIDRTITVNYQVTTANSHNELKKLMKDKAYFKWEKGSTTRFMKGIITSLTGSNSAEDYSSGSFTFEVEGDFSATDLA